MILPDDIERRIILWIYCGFTWKQQIDLNGPPFKSHYIHLINTTDFFASAIQSRNIEHSMSGNEESNNKVNSFDDLLETAVKKFRKKTITN